MARMAPSLVKKIPSGRQVGPLPLVRSEAKEPFIDAKPSGRLMALDCLRTVAVLLVMGAHLREDCIPSVRTDAIRWLMEKWTFIGWCGVDLFFVLSGFLVSGLLFREYRQLGQLHVARFLVRRGLKIYPSFYVFLGATVAWLVWTGTPIWMRALLAELVFIQNYHLGLWGHTWSLAVEEHFYLALPLALSVLIARNRGDRDPFQKLLWMIPLAMLLILGMRCATTGLIEFHKRTHVYPSHLRIDSLLFGALLSYIYVSRRDAFERFFRRWRGLLLLLAIAFAAPIVVADVTHPFTHTVGFTLLALANGILLSTLVVHGVPNIWLVRGLAYVGTFSYSIYLWHLAVNDSQPYVERLIDRSIDPRVWLFVYVIGAAGFGIMMAKLVEMPVLRLRDRFFPAYSHALPDPDRAGTVIAASDAETDDNSRKIAGVCLPTPGEGG